MRTKIVEIGLLLSALAVAAYAALSVGPVAGGFMALGACCVYARRRKPIIAITILFWLIVVGVMVVPYFSYGYVPLFMSTVATVSALFSVYSLPAVALFFTVLVAMAAVKRCKGFAKYFIVTLLLVMLMELFAYARSLPVATGVDPSNRYITDAVKSILRPNRDTTVFYAHRYVGELVDTTCVDFLPNINRTFETRCGNCMDTAAIFNSILIAAGAERRNVFMVFVPTHVFVAGKYGDSYYCSFWISKDTLPSIYADINDLRYEFNRLTSNGKLVLAIFDSCGDLVTPDDMFRSMET